MMDDEFVTLACGQVGKVAVGPNGARLLVCQTCFRDVAKLDDLTTLCGHAERRAKGWYRDGFAYDQGLVQRSKMQPRQRVGPDRLPLHPWGISGKRVLYQHAQHIPHPLVELPEPHGRSQPSTPMPPSAACPRCESGNIYLNYSVQTHSLYQAQVTHGRLVWRKPMGLRETRVATAFATCVNCAESWLFDYEALDELTALGSIKREIPGALVNELSPEPDHTDQPQEAITPPAASDAPLPAHDLPLIQPVLSQALDAPETKLPAPLPKPLRPVRAAKPLPPLPASIMHAPATPVQHFNITHLRPFLDGQSSRFNEAELVLAMSAARKAAHIELHPKASLSIVVRRLCLQGVVNRQIAREVIGGTPYYRWAVPSGK